MTSAASSRGWGPGWPHNNDSKCVNIRAKISGVELRVRREIAPLVKFCIDEVERRRYIYDFGPRDVDDDWGYANRPIAGTRIPSNHSWGLAVDMDAQQYPQGQTRRRPPQWVIDIWHKYRFDNGVYWANPDPMHYEFNGTPNDAAFLVNSLAGHVIANTPPPMPPSAPAPVIITPTPSIPVNTEEDEMKIYALNYSNRIEYWLGTADRKRIMLDPVNDLPDLQAIYPTVTIVGEARCNRWKSFLQQMAYNQF